MEYWLIAGAVIIVLWFLGIYNGIVSRKNNVIGAWSDVVAYERQKQQTFPQIESMAKDFAKHEKKILSDIAKLRSSIVQIDASQVDLEKLALLQTQTTDFMTGINAVAEAYPKLKSADILRDVIAEFAKIQENVAAALTIFNRAVDGFNTGIEQFPNGLVNNATLKLTAYRRFSDSQAESAFEYNMQ
jgi:LemA protein